MSVLSVKFRTAKVVNEKPPYTMYEIEVRASIYENPWILYKRYSEFYKLHSSLQKLKLNGINGLSIPRRQLIRSKASDVIEKRQRELEKYLKTMVTINELLSNKLVLDFLQVPQSLQWLIVKNQQQHGQNDNDPNPSNEPKDACQEFKYEINLFLKQLSFQKNSVKVIQRFEEYYFKKQAILFKNGLKYSFAHEVLYETRKINSTQLITKLFIGDDHCQGLIHSCRLLHSKVAWRAAIALLFRLLNLGTNRFASRFRQVFFNINPALYREMYLHQHIHDETTKNYAFKIVQIIQENAPLLATNLYLNDDAALSKYLQWNEQQMEEEGMNMTGYDKHKYMQLNEEGFDWKKMGYKEISECIFTSFEVLSKESDDNYQRVLTHSMMDKQLNVKYKKDNDTKQWKMKAEFIIDHPAKNVYDYLVNDMMNNKRSEWNTKIMEQGVNKLLDKDHFISNQTYASFNSQDKFIDFILLTCLKYDIKANKYMITFGSVNGYDNLGAQKGKDRAILLPSGFEISSVKDDVNKCMVSYRAHMTNTSVLTISADLLGETDQFFESLLNIDYLMSDE